LAAVFLAGCGGAKSTSSSSAPTTSLTSPPLTTTSQTTRTETTVTLTPTTTATTTTATTAVNARVPARFTIEPGGRATPPTITVPPHFAVELIVVSGDGRPHRAVLHGESLPVPVQGQASTLLRSLPAGSYPLRVDGARRGTLVIGGSPGP
jgi:hypothetical protein